MCPQGIHGPGGFVLEGCPRRQLLHPQPQVEPNGGPKMEIGYSRQGRLRKLHRRERPRAIIAPSPSRVCPGQGGQLGVSRLSGRSPGSAIEFGGGPGLQLQHLQISQIIQSGRLDIETPQASRPFSPTAKRSLGALGIAPGKLEARERHLDRGLSRGIPQQFSLDEGLGQGILGREILAHCALGPGQAHQCRVAQFRVGLCRRQPIRPAKQAQARLVVPPSQCGVALGAHPGGALLVGEWRWVARVVGQIRTGQTNHGQQKPSPPSLPGQRSRRDERNLQEIRSECSIDADLSARCRARAIR